MPPKIPRRATANRRQPSKSEDNSEQYGMESRTRNSGRKISGNLSSKDCDNNEENITHQLPKSGIKRKTVETINEKNDRKSIKMECPEKEENDFTPRRSSRGVIPNRKFKDMEVNFTPGRKQNLKTEKAEVQKKDTRKVQAKTKKLTPATSRNNRTADVKPKNEPVIASAVSIEEIKDDAIVEDDSAHDYNKVIVANTMNTADTQRDEEMKDFPSIKIVKFNSENKIEISDFNPSISKLLELAQNAEQEHHDLQQIFKDSEHVSQPGFTVTEMKIVEVQPEIEKKIEEETNNEGSLLSSSVYNVQTNKDIGDFNTDALSKINSVQKFECNSFSLSQPVECFEKPMETHVMVENIMQKQLDTTISEPIEEKDDHSHVVEDRENDMAEMAENREVESPCDENSKLPKDQSDADGEIHLAVKNALLEMTDKSAESEENEISETSQEETAKSEPSESVSSSGTQTAREVIKLPALNPKSRLGPVKPITEDIEQPLKIDESGNPVKTTNPTKQEFIIVHVPDGQMIKRTSVRVAKPEDCIPFNLDDDGQYHCGVCDYQTNKKVNVLKHRRKHVDDKPHCCPYCKYRTSTSSNLKRHISIHQDIRSFRCHLCNATFRQKIHLERHIRYRHEEKRVKCPLCDYVCANENPDLKVHMKRRHLPQDGEDGSYQAFKCEECGMVTLNKKDFKQHMKFHRSGPELKLFCDFCSFVTDCESRLRRHSYIHSKERPYKCGMCDYRGSQKEHVIRHMRSQHNIEIERKNRKGDDDEDDSLSGSIDSRDEPQEMKIVQTEQKTEKHDYSSQEKIFACNHCSMKFSKLLNLYKHLHAQHKEILPEPTGNEFLCVVCDFKTTTKKNLLVHMRKHNQIDQIPPSHVYSCVLCNYINPKRRNLFQHMKKKHGIEIVMKDDGSTSCFVTDGNIVSSKCDEAVQNILTIGDMVTTETEEQELQIVTEDLDKDGMQVQNVISFDDLAYAVSHPQPHNRNLIVVEPNTPLVQEHEAAEAIEGLQALAEQPGIVSNQEVMTEQQLITADVVENIKTENETEVVTLETNDDQNDNVEKTEGEDGLQLSADEVMHLSAGDFVEINGEMYKVEIREDPGTNTEIVADTS
ncbi:Hypothetical predicted protein [Mytilus galloprovincialis]|uniref:C2H2-type domain-containing protein n=1 Tax=Mytilus galloprovincialis TaxID=29158 RepID=A0A8B6FLR1_MYTGA|nr:Hypothetical predicted protein [Mytilus galloprovincialis]